MAKEAARRGSFAGALVLIALGALFLYANLQPGLNPWPIVSRYWPLLLIFLGLGKLWDYLWLRSHPDSAPVTGLSGAAIAILILLLIFGVALSRSVGERREIHQVESVELQGANEVRVHLGMPSGELRLAGGAGKLLEADFDYDDAQQKPRVEYNVAGGQGRLDVTQEGSGMHIGRTQNSWNLHLANGVPMELNLEMGAGRGDLRLAGLSLTSLVVHMGAGELTVDLRGDWKKSMQVNIQGGAGRATIRLPKNVGVRARASGGLGSINATGLVREGDVYVNEAYGKSPVTLQINVEGGVGEIELIPEA